MLIDLFRDVSFVSMTLILVALGVGWYYLACGGLYVLLHRSKLSKRVHRWRTQRTWPTPTQVRGEILDGTLSMSMVMIVVSASFWLGIHGYSGLYADPSEYGLLYIPVSIALVFVTMEVFEWTFHWACHRNSLLWKIHKHHHRYSNPTSFGVMADQPIDMLIKASPILWIPLLFPIWDVALIGTFATMNFIYGTYLHAGFDFPFMPSPHSRFLVGAWHHNEHHAGSVDHNYGFFTGFMDLLFKTRFTPSDKAAKRPNYRCPECRNREAAAA
jgi:sterol desaturase/sphingolipid hydroxylase (fatty acid hydroxylase superfamily)